MTDIDVKLENIDNTFIPRARNKKLSINAIITFIRFGICKIDDIPPDVKKLVLPVLYKNRNPHRQSSAKQTESNQLNY